MAGTHAQSDQHSSNTSLDSDTSHAFMDIPMDVAHTVEISVDDMLDESTEYNDVPSDRLTIFGKNDVSDQDNTRIIGTDNTLQDGIVSYQCDHITDGSDRLVSERSSHEVTQNQEVTSESRHGIAPLSEIPTADTIPIGLTVNTNSHSENISYMRGFDKPDINSSVQLENVSLQSEPSSSVYDSRHDLAEQRAETNCEPHEADSVTTVVFSTAPEEGGMLPQDMIIPVAVDSNITTDVPSQRYLMCTDTDEMNHPCVHPSGGLIVAPGLVLYQYAKQVQESEDFHIKISESKKQGQAQKKLKGKNAIGDKQNTQPCQGKRRQTWTEDAMQLALRAVGHGKSVRSSARDYKIPHQTLVTRINKLKCEKTFKRYEHGGDLFDESGIKMESPCKKIRGKRNSLWTEKLMQSAIKLCEDGSSIKKAAKIYGIPVGTLHGRVTGRVKNEGKVGHPTYLTSEEECELEKKLLKIIPKGFNATYEVVKTFLSEKGKDCDSLFGKYGPGKRWWVLFVSRHPKIAKKIVKLWENDKLVVEDKSNHDLLNECFNQTEKIDDGKSEKVICITANETPLSNVSQNLCHNKQGQADFIKVSETVCCSTQLDHGSSGSCKDQTNVSVLNTHSSSLPNLTDSLASDKLTSEPVTSDCMTLPLFFATESASTPLPIISKCEIRSNVSNSNCSKGKCMQINRDDVTCSIVTTNNCNIDNNRERNAKSSLCKRIPEVVQLNAPSSKKSEIRIESRKPKWNEKGMRGAIEAVRTGKLGVRAAARKFGIPHSTLVTRIEKLRRDQCYYLPIKKGKAKQPGMKSSELDPQALGREECEVDCGVKRGLGSEVTDQPGSKRICGTANVERLECKERSKGESTSKRPINQTLKKLKRRMVKNHKPKRKRESETSKCTKGLCKRRLWTEYDMAQACQACKDERFTISEASRIFGIPRPTLYMRLSGKYEANVPLGRKTYLTPNEEDKLEKEIIFCAKKGKTLTQGIVASYVMNCVKGRPHPFKEDGPKKTWWKLFMKRHPKVEQHILGLWQKTSEKPSDMQR